MGNKNTKELYLYIPRSDCKLPDNGWLQPCYNCEKVVSNNVFLCKLYERRKKYMCYVYLCRSCEKQYKKNLIINRKEFINDLIHDKKLNPIKIIYNPVEPCPPLPLDVPSNFPTI